MISILSTEPYKASRFRVLQVLGLAINSTLTSCEQRGFRSVALPLLGTGAALSFPDSVVARVLLEGIHSFRQSRVSRATFLVRIIIHPNEKESAEVIKPQGLNTAFLSDPTADHLDQACSVIKSWMIPVYCVATSPTSNIVS